MMKNKKGFEFSFGWLFAIIVGAVIIFLAIYAATNLIKTERKIADTEAAKQFGLLLSPIETSLESGKIAKISFPGDTRLYNDCRDVGNFGAQDIRVASKSGVGNEWQSAGVPSTFYNKYIFSPEAVEGKEFTIFSKPFYFPYKVGDLTFIWADKYCFVNPPIDIEEEIDSLNPRNINITGAVKECSKDSIKVCFTSSGCDIDVSLTSKSVRKNKKTVYYEDDSLLYGAIFADSDIYECQIKRLMKRTSELSLLYLGKSQRVSAIGCSSANMEGDLSVYANTAMGVNSSLELREISYLTKELERKNGILSCKLF